MHLFVLFSILVTLAAIFSYLNVRFIKLPLGISMMLMGAIASIGLVYTGWVSTSFTDAVKVSLSELNFSRFILEILLSFLLFAGSLHVRWSDIRSSAKSILGFATIGTLISSGVIGISTYYLLPLFGIHIPLINCLLFGALISPTDPIAVMGILSKEKISKPIEIRIVGESLFNDGIGVVIFITLLGINLQGLENTTFTSVLLLFLRETIGGVLVGLVVGLLGFRLMKTIDDFQTEILISIAMVMGGYAFCNSVHVSGALAMVVAGLLTGNKGRREAMSDVTMDYLEKFWEVVDNILNALLFMLIGLEIIIVEFKSNYVWVGIVTAVCLIITRYISLLVPAHLLRIRRKLDQHTLEIMTWGGLRGGISIALALSLQPSQGREVFVAITFVIVLFTIVVQGLSIRPLIQYLNR